MRHRISLLLLVPFGLALPAGAATYNYLLQGSNTPSVPGFNISWQSNSLNSPSWGMSGVINTYVLDGVASSGPSADFFEFCFSVSQAIFEAEFAVGGPVLGTEDRDGVLFVCLASMKRTGGESGGM